MFTLLVAIATFLVGSAWLLLVGRRVYDWEVYAEIDSSRVWRRRCTRGIVAWPLIGLLLYVYTSYGKEEAFMTDMDVPNFFSFAFGIGLGWWVIMWWRVLLHASLMSHWVAAAQIIRKRKAEARKARTKAS